MFHSRTIYLPGFNGALAVLAAGIGLESVCLAQQQPYEIVTVSLPDCRAFAGLSLQYHISQSVAGNNSCPSVPAVLSVSVDKNVDECSPGLSKAVVEGRHIPEVRISVLSTIGEQITLKEATIASVAHSADPRDPTQLIETIAFNYSTIGIDSDAGISFLTAFNTKSSPVRNDYSGFVGAEITVGANPLGITSLGRLCVPPNSSTHAMRLLEADTLTEVASTSLDMSGCVPNAMWFADINIAATLEAGGKYYLVSEETEGGDPWYNISPITTTNVASVTGAVWSPDGIDWRTNNSPNTTFGPVAFTYNVLPPRLPTPFVTSFNLKHPPLRNDFSGYVGMQFSVGSNPITVAQIGRLCVAGNSDSHGLVFVDARTSGVVPNSAVSVRMANCIPGQFAYVSPGGPLTLAANSVYYLESLETSGGDQWFDSGSLATTNIASVLNSAWTADGINWHYLSGPNSSYVPLNFTY